MYFNPKPQHILMPFPRLALQIVVREVGRLRPLSEYLFPAATNIIAETAPGPEKESFENRLSTCKSLWTDVDGRTEDREQVIQRIYPAAQNYDDAYKELAAWLSEAEQTIINLVSVPCDQEGLARQQRNLKVSAHGLKGHFREN